MTFGKTFFGGLGAILTGVTMTVNGVKSKDFNLAYQGILAAFAGLGAIGIGHKLDKNTTAVNLMTEEGLAAKSR